MRLTKLKIAGFKSFVDPTTVTFPSSLTGVVGPNGCGKSNIIDAVRWVMGEISAKHLRGESMADVIFNGSAARKPLGHGVGRTGVRQQPRARSAAPTRATTRWRCAAGEPRWHLGLFHQRHQGAPQGHHPDVPRHGAGLAQLRHHRAGHDLAHDRGAAGRTARVSGGGGGHLALQGAPPRDREPHRADAREPRSSERFARGGREADPPPAAPGGHGAALSGAQGGGAQAAGGTAGAAPAGSGPRGRACAMRRPSAAKRPCRRVLADLREVEVGNRTDPRRSVGEDAMRSAPFRRASTRRAPRSRAPSRAFSMRASCSSASAPIWSRPRRRCRSLTA